MDKATIMKKIEERVMSEEHKDYTMWTIGVTDDPNTRKDQHKSNSKNVDFWTQWNADNEKDARDIEEFYLKKKKMKGGGGGPGTADYVYIF